MIQHMIQSICMHLKSFWTRLVPSVKCLRVEKYLECRAIFRPLNVFKSLWNHFHSIPRRKLGGKCCICIVGQMVYPWNMVKFPNQCGPFAENCSKNTFVWTRLSHMKKFGCSVTSKVFLWSWGVTGHSLDRHILSFGRGFQKISRKNSEKVRFFRFLRSGWYLPWKKFLNKDYSDVVFHEESI